MTHVELVRCNLGEPNNMAWKDIICLAICKQMMPIAWRVHHVDDAHHAEPNIPTKCFDPWGVPSLGSNTYPSLKRLEDVQDSGACKQPPSTLDPNNKHVVGKQWNFDDKYEPDQLDDDDWGIESHADDTEVPDNDWTFFTKGSKCRKFPPPLDSLYIKLDEDIPSPYYHYGCGTTTATAYSLRSFRTKGRFVLREERAPTYEYLKVWRKDGCLKMDLMYSRPPTVVVHDTNSC